MKGRRVDVEPHLYEPGDYGPWLGSWYARVPRSDIDLTANLSKHQVVEHEDGTITVSPSILCDRGHGESWHGYLERGVWRIA